jgi:DNA-binding CsgD family transcriptional regulator
MRTRDAAFIRKLCSLPLSAQGIAQCVLPALRGLIPAHSAAVFWVDDKFEITNLYAERMLSRESMSAYYERHYRAARRGFATAFRQRAARADPVSFATFSAAERDTEYFRDVMHPLDAYHVLYGILADRQRAFAQLSLYRGRDDGAFDRDDAATLRELLRYLAAGLSTKRSAQNVDTVSITVEEQLGIVAADGTIVSAPEGFMRLLRLAALSEVSPRGAVEEAPAIRAFVQKLNDLWNDRKREPLPPHSAHETPWGRFSIHGFALADAHGTPDGRTALLIRREEPRTVALVRGTGNSTLSPQQREVALLVAEGRSNPEIATELGLSLNTASYHVKEVFRRLGIRERAAVVERLLELARSRR